MRLQVPMVGKGVVESMLRVLVAVQGGGAEALDVQKVACISLCNLAVAADNAVRVLVAGRGARCMNSIGVVVSVICAREPAAALMLR